MSVKAVLSGKILDRLEQHTPARLQCLQLQVLLDTTAQGFEVGSVKLPRGDAAQALLGYALFTQTAMERVLAAGQVPPTVRLYRKAYALGAKIRRLSGFTEARDLQRLTFYLYRNLRITMTGEIPGAIEVPDCYFSHLYTPGQCAVMSRVDSGFIAGLFGGGTLQFSQKITEGCDVCRACFHKGGHGE